jgi:hypothetical protein
MLVVLDFVSTLLDAAAIVARMWRDGNTVVR